MTTLRAELLNYIQTLPIKEPNINPYCGNEDDARDEAHDLCEWQVRQDLLAILERVEGLS